jgi:calcineurin-like phosphoesterase family protein
MADHPLETPGRVFVTADNHFGQADAIASYDRSFTDAEAMESAYIEGINELVGADDLLLHLGDFVGDLDSRKRKIRVANEVRERLTTERLVLVRGNHDPDHKDFNRLFSSVHDLLSFRRPADGPRVICCHYPLRGWRGNRKGSVHLHGHAHGRLEEIGRSTDVGVDCWRGRPIPLDDLVASLSGREIVAFPMRRIRRQPDRSKP